MLTNVPLGTRSPQFRTSVLEKETRRGNSLDPAPPEIKYFIGMLFDNADELNVGIKVE